MVFLPASISWLFFFLFHAVAVLASLDKVCSLRYPHFAALPQRELF
ncbi:hypothetical protein PROVRUST_07006 [Providencia rustigianii DSM 4541]|uniref:Uncharacterized protein n=1 Tax=Providencia rustigianii DSM 4541 TaxID=500637 RepID=D1P455_9GAMM|nr:hypothetical protein PROVRUST_07006 [Providencia rustigianii DSM 4541]